MVKRRSRQKLNFKKIQKALQSFSRSILRFFPFVVVFGLAYFIFLNARSMVHADAYFQVEKVTVYKDKVPEVLATPAQTAINTVATSASAAK